MNDPILFDMAASEDDNVQALMDAMLTGRPLTITDTADPDGPEITMELGIEIIDNTREDTP